MHMNTLSINSAHRGGLLTGLWAAALLTALSATAPARADVDLPSNSNSKPATTGIAAVLGQKKSAEPDFQPPDQAFRFSALPDGPQSIRLIWGVTDGYYLYRARIKASSDNAQVKLGDLTMPWWARSPWPDRAPAT